MRTMAPARGRQLLDFEQYGFGGLLNIQDSQQELADNELRVATNVYGGPDGDLTMRRGMTAQGPLCGSGGGNGIFRFYQELSGGAVVSNKVTLQQVGGTLFNADTGVQIGATNALGASALPWSVVRVFDPAYNSGTDVLIICTGSGGPYVFDGTTITTYAGGPTTVTGARWCAMVNNVVYFAGIPAQPNLLVASQVGLPESLPGYAVFTTSYPITGLGTLGLGLQTNLVAGMTRGVVLFSGVTPNSYIEQEIPNNDGVEAGRSMVTVDGVLYFIGTYAIYRYDGSAFVEISRKVRPWIVNDPAAPEFPMNGDRTKSWAMYYQRRIFFWYASNATTPNTALVWHLDLEGWTIYTGVSLNSGCLLDAPGDADPHAVVVVSGLKGQQYAFDVYADSNLNASDAGATISAQFTTKFFKTGTPGAVKRLLRTVVEIFSVPLSPFSGAVSVTTDYGTVASVGVSLIAAATAAQWDVSQWDVAAWAVSGLAYSKTRLDWNLAGEAFAFGVQTPSPNATPGAYGTWRFMGLTGRIGNYPRN